MLAKNKDERPTMEEVAQALLGPGATQASVKLSGVFAPAKVPKGAISGLGLTPVPASELAGPPSISDLSDHAALANDTVVNFGNHPSTLQKSVGQIDEPSDSQITPTRDSSSPSRSGLAAGGRVGTRLAGLLQRRRLLVAAGAGLPVLIGCLVWIFRSPSHPVAPPPRPAQAQPQLLHWSLRSTPAQAEVVRESDGAIVGTTPWQRELLVGQGAESYLVRLPGYRDGHITLDRSQSAESLVTLEATPAPTLASPPAAKPRPHSGKPHSPDKSKAHGKTLLVD
jgi:hypothetical protein